MTWLKESKPKLFLAAGLLLVAVIWLTGLQRESARQLTYVIPAGTAQKIESGQPGVIFPDEIVLTVGVRDTIVIENQDDTVHTFGPFVIGPHATLTKRFENPQVVAAACTFHQDQQMRLVVLAAPWDIFN